MNTLPPINHSDIAVAASGLKVLIVPGKGWRDYAGLAARAYDAGNFEEAAAMWQVALQIAEGDEIGEREIAHILEEMVLAYYESGDLDAAEVYGKRALVAMTRAYGGQHARTGNCLNNLAGIYFSKGRLPDALAVCQTVVAIYEKTYGCDHPEVGLAMHNLAMIFHALGKSMHAEKHYRRAYALRANALGVNDPSVVKLVLNYATLLESTGRTTEAQRIRGKVAVTTPPK